MRFLLVILSSDLIMSSSNDHANREEGQDQSFILQVMQQYFARFEVQVNDMRDWTEQNKEVLRQVLIRDQ